MFYRKISANSLNTKRLDSDFYRPEYLVIDEVLSHLNCVKLGSIGHFFTGPFGSKLPSSLYVEEGIPLFRVANVGQFEVITESFVYLAPKSHEELKASEVLPGDLLIVKASVGEKICKIPESLPKANITQHIIAIRPKNYMDIDYISTFLFSYYGVGQLQRYSLGSIIQYLGVTDTKNVSLYYPHLVAQKYIGDKVRQAEQLRAWAERSVAILKNKFSAMYEPLSSYDSFKKSSYPIQPEKLFEVLTPASYPPHIEKYFEKNRFVTLGEICSNIYIGKTLPSLDNGKGVLQVTSRSCSGLFLKHPMNVVENKANVVPLKKKDIVLTNAAHDKNYIGKDVSFNHSDDLILPSAKVIVIRINSKNIPVAYVHSYLMTSAGYTQWQSIVRGISAGIHPSDVASRIRIPLPNDESTLAGMAEESDRLYVEAGLAQEISRLLTIAAKNLVEALIEGNLTEDQLIQAQQALEDGDNTLTPVRDKRSKKR